MFVGLQYSCPGEEDDIDFLLGSMNLGDGDGAVLVSHVCALAVPHPLPSPACLAAFLALEKLCWNVCVL